VDNPRPVVSRLLAISQGSEAYLEMMETGAMVLFHIKVSVPGVMTEVDGIRPVIFSWDKHLNGLAWKNVTVDMNGFFVEPLQFYKEWQEKNPG